MRRERRHLSGVCVKRAKAKDVGDFDENFGVARGRQLQENGLNTSGGWKASKNVGDGRAIHVRQSGVEENNVRVNAAGLMESVQARFGDNDAEAGELERGWQRFENSGPGGGNEDDPFHRLSLATIGVAGNGEEAKIRLRLEGNLFAARV